MIVGMFDRWYAGLLGEKIQRPYVHLVFGARQTGKSTLLRSMLPKDALTFDLADPVVRSRLSGNPGLFMEACRSVPATHRGQMVFVDEAQMVPALFDAVQSLYDPDKTRWRFILCSSSARRLRRTGANLLPGRSFLHRLYPLTLAEHPPVAVPPWHATSPLAFPWPQGRKHENPFPAWGLEERLAFGALPGVVAAPRVDRADLLKTFVAVHLEEEVQREAWLRDWAAFVRFLQLAARESGQVLNYAALSQEAGVALTTVKSHYQLLEDMFVGIRIPAYKRSPRKNLLSTPKFLLFDLGVRNAAAGLAPSEEVVQANPGPLFEQWVGIELWKRLQYLGEGTLYYLRTRDGAEVDYIIERGETLTAIEVKWTQNPTVSDARHVLTFLNEHPDQPGQGYIVCLCDYPLQLHERVTAIPWFCL
ncbi:MAG: ATP-binding protein [Planctomycetes bacterium]|nr:ATP-binding protein [Planctomycetota bacterium]